MVVVSFMPPPCQPEVVVSITSQVTSVNLMASFVERGPERLACVHRLVQRLLGGARLRRERVPGGRDDARPTEADVAERASGARGATIELGQLRRCRDPARPEQ